MNKTAQAMFGLSFLTISFGTVAGYHHTHLREQRGNEIITIAKGESDRLSTSCHLVYVRATLPFLDNGYLQGTVTLQEVEDCSKIKGRNNYICTVTFSEFPEIPATLKVYAPTLKEKTTVDELITACQHNPEQNPSRCDTNDVLILEQLSLAQKYKEDYQLNKKCEPFDLSCLPRVYIDGVPGIGAAPTISLHNVVFYGRKNDSETLY